jgi:hypothetical protein
LALALTAGAPAPVLGADQTRTPSAEELREAYPLDPSEDAGGGSTAPPERGAATPTPAPTRQGAQPAATAQRGEVSRPAAEDDGGLSPWLTVGLLAVLVTAAATAAVVVRRRSGAAPPEDAQPPKGRAPTPLLAVFGPAEPSTPPASDAKQPADQHATTKASRELGARRANGVAAAPAVAAAAGARRRRSAAVGQAPGQGGRSLAVLPARSTRAAGPEPRAGGGEPAKAPREPDLEPGVTPSQATGSPDVPVPAIPLRDDAERRPPEPPERAPAPEPPDPEVAWTAAIEWRATGGQPRFAVLATADEGGEAIEIATSEPVRWPPAGPDDVAALNAVVASLEQALVGAGWSALTPGDAWYAKRFAWAPPKTSEPERPAPPARRFSASDATHRSRRGEAEAPASRRPGPPRQALTPQPQPQTRAPRPGEPGSPPGAAGETVEESGAGRFVRRRPWLEGTETLWRCEVQWDAGYRMSRFTATMRRPRARRGQVVAASEPFKWMLMTEPSDDGADYRAAVDALVRALQTAGWERIDTGPEWWGERFVWRHDEPPPDRVDVEPVNTDPGDSQP